MKKINLRIAVPIAAGVVIVGLIVLLLIFGRTDKAKMSAPFSTGNSAGNLYNKGLFCKHGDVVYFSNHNDGGSLYSMSSDLTDFKKLYNDKIRYINADDNYIYYSRMNNLKSNSAENFFTVYSNGIYRFDPLEKDLFMLMSKPLGSLVVYNNRVMFQKYDSHSALSLCSIDLNGDDEKEIYSDDAVGVSAFNGKLYYADLLHDHYIHSVNLSTGTNTVELNKGAYQPIATATGIYYIATTEKYKLYKYSYDGTTELIAPYRLSTFNITDGGTYIFYQRDEGESSGVYLYNAITKETTQIVVGDYKWLNVIGNYCFFYDFAGEHVYACDTSGVLSIFNPPVVE